MENKQAAQTVQTSPGHFQDHDDAEEILDKPDEQPGTLCTGEPEEGKENVSDPVIGAFGGNVKGDVVVR